jgi:hypothetical protein
MTRSWTIGSRPDCDLVVDSPRVSGCHCRLTRDERGYVLEDLGSTNGTYVNGSRITDPVRVARGDSVTLGATSPMPWPPETASAATVEVPTLRFRGPEMVIGRASDCDHVLDFQMV